MSAEVEAWVEVNIVTSRTQDETLLQRVGDLVHQQLQSEIETWFYFWEPELRLRIRWRDPARALAHEDALGRALDAWKAAGQIKDWYAGAHGMPGARYVGEAEHYGVDVWLLVQRDWMNGSELALLLIALDRADRLPHPREYYWQRHVHLFTNQLLGTWEAEVQQCLRQALGYLRLLGKAPAEAKKLLRELQQFK
jgi:hypothetical protein